VKLNQNEFDRFRHNIEHEDNLINHRTSWLLISQSFLLGACVAANTYPFVIKVVGTIIAISSELGTVAAICALDRLRRECSAGFEGTVPPLISDPVVHWMGLVAPLALPIVFAIVWWVV
jgi:hypothetical protein